MNPGTTSYFALSPPQRRNRSEGKGPWSSRMTCWPLSRSSWLNSRDSTSWDLRRALDDPKFDQLLRVIRTYWPDRDLSESAQRPVLHQMLRDVDQLMKNRLPLAGEGRSSEGRSHLSGRSRRPWRFNQSLGESDQSTLDLRSCEERHQREALLNGPNTYS